MTNNSMNSTTRNIKKGLSVLAVATAITVGPALAANADPASDGVIGGSNVGGYSDPFSSLGNAYSSTTCNGYDDTISTSVQMSPADGFSQQLVASQIWVQNLAGSGWVAYGWQSLWIAESHTLTGSYSAADPVLVNSLSLQGVAGQYYQVAVETMRWDGGQWVHEGFSTSAHFTTWGATEYNIYGQQIQSLPGASADNCVVL